MQTQHKPKFKLKKSCLLSNSLKKSKQTFHRSSSCPSRPVSPHSSASTPAPCSAAHHRCTHRLRAGSVLQRPPRGSSSCTKRSSVSTCAKTRETLAFSEGSISGSWFLLVVRSSVWKVNDFSPRRKVFSSRALRCLW